VAKAQNIAAEQQQLVTITIAIERAFNGQQAAEDQAAGNRTGTARSAAVAQADLEIVAETTADLRLPQYSSITSMAKAWQASNTSR
jgi:hypothetical protein